MDFKNYHPARQSYNCWEKQGPRESLFGLADDHVLTKDDKAHMSHMVGKTDMLKMPLTSDASLAVHKQTKGFNL